ncbi:type IV secretory system conjugative DNA transfer family protein [Streptomyces sp. 378]|uniref:type IV secretory system conjugative DNA transfer family protein n=1 Tax=Streptomyces sp. 378 TaxID=3049412 RepID=UPI0024C2DDC0|nr:type IV secretory system conjugative DNA transfer family protein [Streptomyces sp. 378]MDK1347452.1 type IV secretory system conjugative DNA transfer family protein [Streptomyces sp. 378]
MRPDDRHTRRGTQGGIPDGLLVGILAFLLGMTVLVWTATGLAALFAHGSWPSGVTFTRTPPAMRGLIAEPHDIPGAWPGTPPGELSGYGLFWGLFIGQLMILVVLTVFVMGTLARWRAVRAWRRAEKATYAAGPPTQHDAPGPAQQDVQGPVQHDVPRPVQHDAPTTTTPHEVPTPRRAAPEPTHVLEPTPAPGGPPHPTATPAPQTTAPATAIPTTPAALFAQEQVGERERILVAPRETRQATATQAVRDAEGPALVVTSNPSVWQDTKDARAKLGPTHLYDPTHLCDTPSRLHWSPTAGCEDRDTATRRATALLTPVRPTAKLDQAVSDTAATLLRSYLHAAAIDGRTIRHVHRWSQGTQLQDAVRILRTNPKAAPGSAGELEGALTAHPERRDMAQQLTTRALTALSTVNIREACTPNRTDALALDSFVHEGGTLYVVGESIEDPRTNPGAMPLLTALVSSVVERGRHMAERSSAGRLDPPMTLVLDDVAAVAPLPQLPELLATGADRGMPTLALLRSREQGRARWPHDELPV